MPAVLWHLLVAFRWNCAPLLLPSSLPFCYVAPLWFSETLLRSPFSVLRTLCVRTSSWAVLSALPSCRSGAEWCKVVKSGAKRCKVVQLH